MPNLSVGLVLASFATGLMTVAGDPPRREQYERIVGEFDAARARAVDASRIAKTEAVERAIKWPRPTDYYPRLMALADDRTDDDAARMALIWVLSKHVEAGANGARVPIALRAVDALLKDHKDDEAVGLLTLGMVSFASSPRDRFLRALFEQTSHRPNRGRACLALAQYLKMKGECAQQMRTPAFRAADPALDSGFYGAAYLRTLMEIDPGPLLAESEQLFEKVLAEYADIEYPRHPRRPDQRLTLGDVATKDLDELRHLSVGKQAPEINGPDVDGREMTLSESRGKVVVLVFWGTWCGSCMAQVPRERALAERMKGRPFALLGVNSDEDREKLKEAIGREKIAGRSWFDGGKVGGPIASRWNVKFWPTVYILDHRGVIRAREVSDMDFLDTMVETLVSEAEADVAKPRSIR